MTERWRVGTLSLGLSFVTVGVLILFAQFAGKDAVGDTMYVTVRGLPEKQGFVHQYSFLHLTVVVPEKVKVETDPPQ